MGEACTCSAFFAEPTQDEEDALQPSGGPDPHDTGGLMTLLFEGSTGRLLSLYQAPGSAIPLGALCSDPARSNVLLAPARARAAHLWQLILQQLPESLRHTIGASTGAT